MMLYLILLITAACSTVCGTSQDGDTQWSTSGLCYIRKGCQGIALTKPSPDDVSPMKDLCRAVGDKLNSLDPTICESLLCVEREDQADKDKPHPDDVEDQLPQTDLASLALSGRTNYFSDCSEIHTALSLFNAVSSGVHDIMPLGLTSPISVYCDQTTDGGGWTVMQRRFDGSIDFNRPYNDFRYGFGSANGEQWLGLENMYRLTDQNAYELYIELEDWDSVVKYARYSSFSVGGGYNYRLSVGGYSGTAGDGLDLSSSSSAGYLSGQAFSARDVDRSGTSCAGSSGLTGGWWYKSCGYSALNGPYLRPSDRTSHSGCGIYWYAFGGSYKYYLKKSKMMVRPANFQPRHQPYKMWFYRLIVLTAVLQWSVVAGEDRTDQFNLSLCKLWEDCVKTVKVAEDKDVVSLQTICQDVAQKLREHDVWNCESLLAHSTKTDAGNDEQPEHVMQPQSNPTFLALSLLGRTNYLSDCSEIHTALTMLNDVTSGVHDIMPLGLTSPISVYCDQTTDGGGWTVIQRRFDGSVDFNRPYDDFGYGFGFIDDGEQWLGLENMYYLTRQNAYELYIELEDWAGVVKYAKYSSFSVGSGSYYRLSVSGYSGTAGDGFYLSDSSSGAYLSGQAFSGRDVDRDADGGSCAGGKSSITGGWWYKYCGHSALNGPYLRPSDRTSHSGYGIYWFPFGGSYKYYLKKSKMMVRPANFQP
ncbi:hypothetical protein Bbelb_192090 [Branchiostoma belcheri]|nr:hypothetical protein Bbelb_192090 [Branchiostoma belcheri]